MQPTHLVEGTAMPLRRSDVDTDQIIPAEWLKRVERTGFGEGLFGAWRSDREFVLNDPRYRDATVLVAGPNFGVGSSREHAVWALMDHGFRAVVSPQFGDIFRSNSTKAGLVPVTAPEDAVQAIWAAVEADPTTAVVVDVVDRRLRCPAAGVDVEFPMDDFTRMRFVEGLDDVGLTLRHADAIDAYEAARPRWLPSTTPA